jgi:hypothetical protein
MAAAVYRARPNMSAVYTGCKTPARAGSCLTLRTASTDRASRPPSQ